MRILHIAISVTDSLSRFTEVLENQLDLARGEAFLRGTVVALAKGVPQVAVVLEFATEKALHRTRAYRWEIGNGEVEFEKVSSHGCVGVWL